MDVRHLGMNGTGILSFIADFAGLCNIGGMAG
jgi:hypothetical protein